MDGHFCDNCETHLNDSDYTSYGSWSYTCHTCGFTYRHGASPVQEQVDKFNNVKGDTMEFLTNTHDPKDKCAKMYVARSIHETPAEAWAHHVEWLKDKVIGDPQATEAYTVEQLKEMGLVGVYRK